MRRDGSKEGKGLLGVGMDMGVKRVRETEKGEEAPWLGPCLTSRPLLGQGSLSSESPAVHTLKSLPHLDRGQRRGHLGSGVWGSGIRKECTANMG